MYLRDMLDQKKADDFSAWRARQYERRGFAAELAAPFLPGKYLTQQKVGQSRNQDPRFRAFVRPRQKVDSATRIAIWEAQNGSCAHCGAKRALQLVEAPNAYSSSIEAVDEAEGGAAVEKFVALCNQCTMRNKSVSPSAHQS
jgi:5-methylcytosine-specific restriction endonuclease McrA